MRGLQNHKVCVASSAGSTYKMNRRVNAASRNCTVERKHKHVENRSSVPCCTSKHLQAVLCHLP